MWISHDGVPFSAPTGLKTWFYFLVKGVSVGETLTFTIRNLNYQTLLFKLGLRPVFRQQGQKAWKRTSGKLTWDCTEAGLVLTFVHTFGAPKKDATYFAFTYPFSYQEYLDKDRAMEEKFKNHKEIYFNRELLGYSLEGRRMELLTITGYDECTEEREEMIPFLFPEHEGDASLRPYRFNKPTVFLSARVHPGETASSFVLNGILDFLTNEKNEQAAVLRKRFVFKVIPMLNPDGVYRGYYRLDTKC